MRILIGMRHWNGLTIWTDSYGKLSEKEMISRIRKNSS